MCICIYLSIINYYIYIYQKIIVIHIQIYTHNTYIHSDEIPASNPHSNHPIVVISSFRQASHLHETRPGDGASGHRPRRWHLLRRPVPRWALGPALVVKKQVWASDIPSIIHLSSIYDLLECSGQFNKPLYQSTGNLGHLWLVVLRCSNSQTTEKEQDSLCSKAVCFWILQSIIAALRVNRFWNILATSCNLNGVGYHSGNWLDAFLLFC